MGCERYQSDGMKLLDGEMTDLGVKIETGEGAISARFWPEVAPATATACRRSRATTSFAGSCPACGGPMFADAFHSHRPTSGQDLRSKLHRPLYTLSDRSIPWVVVSRADKAHWFRADDGRRRRARANHT